MARQVVCKECGEIGTIRSENCPNLSKRIAAKDLKYGHKTKNPEHTVQILTGEWDEWNQSFKPDRQPSWTLDTGV